jgi:hypothetical protein
MEEMFQMKIILPDLKTMLRLGSIIVEVSFYYTILALSGKFLAVLTRLETYNPSLLEHKLSSCVLCSFFKDA